MMKVISSTANETGSSTLILPTDVMLDRSVETPTGGLDAPTVSLATGFGTVVSERALALPISMEASRSRGESSVLSKHRDTKASRSSAYSSYWFLNSVSMSDLISRSDFRRRPSSAKASLPVVRTVDTIAAAVGKLPAELLCYRQSICIYKRPSFFLLKTQPVLENSRPVHQKVRLRTPPLSRMGRNPDCCILILSGGQDVDLILRPQFAEGTVCIGRIQGWRLSCLANRRHQFPGGQDVNLILRPQFAEGAVDIGRIQGWYHINPVRLDRVLSCLSDRCHRFTIDFPQDYWAKWALLQLI